MNLFKSKKERLADRLKIIALGNARIKRYDPTEAILSLGVPPKLSISTTPLAKQHVDNLDQAQIAEDHKQEEAELDRTNAPVLRPLAIGLFCFGMDVASNAALINDTIPSLRAASLPIGFVMSAGLIHLLRQIPQDASAQHKQRVYGSIVAALTVVRMVGDYLNNPHFHPLLSLVMGLLFAAISLTATHLAALEWQVWDDNRNQNRQKRQNRRKGKTAEEIYEDSAEKITESEQEWSRLEAVYNQSYYTERARLDLIQPQLAIPERLLPAADNGSHHIMPLNRRHIKASEGEQL